MKIVTPFRPFAPESGSHLRLGRFDWPAAIAMLRASVRARMASDVYTLTDFGTSLAGPVYRFQADESRLMLWLLDVVRAYLRSPYFDDDTILISPDALVVRDLATLDLFRADLGLMVRTAKKYIDKPLLNGVQCWRVAARDRLIDFYDRALQRARQSPPALLRWGADTAPIVDLLDPLVAGPMQRGNLSVYGFEAAMVFRTIGTAEGEAVARGVRPTPTAPIVDFKGQRKIYMAQYFAALHGRAVAC